MNQFSRQEDLIESGGSDRPAQKLIADLKVLSDDTRELLRQTASQSGERLARVRERARVSLAAVEERLGPLQNAITERGRNAARVSMSHVRDHPWSTIAAAAAIACAIAAVMAWQREPRRGDHYDEP